MQTRILVGLLFIPLILLPLWLGPEWSAVLFLLLALIGGYEFFHMLMSAGYRPVTWRWIYSFYVYPNTLTTVKVTGAEVVEILEHAAAFYEGLECSVDGDCTVLTNASVPHYNVDTMAGLSYRVDPTRPEGGRVHDVRVGGRAIDLHREFTLVCNNYRAAGGGGYPHLAEADRVWQSSEEMTDIIGDFIARAGSWQPESDGNWWLGPAMIAERPAAVTH